MTDRESILQPNATSNDPPAASSVLRDARKTDGLDVWLLDDSLTKSPWERMLANDDALNFAESLRAAMEKRHAKP